MTEPHGETLVIRAELDARINFATQQNDVPVVKVLHVENLTDEPVHNVQVRISAEPDFCQAWQTHIATIPEGGTFSIPAVDVQLSSKYLADLTECVRGHLSICASVDGEEQFQSLEPVELLARNEWAGQSSLPELLAAFVLPNNPVIAQVLREAADLLGEWTGDPSLSGYQSKDPKRSFLMAAAIYGAMQKLELTYINPPASFEEEGQRVRVPDDILATRMGTCLDLALLAAGCLEQAGLNALVLLVPGHAFAGIWLNDECFPEAAIVDLLRLRKRVDLKEITVFDPTGIASRPTLSFEQSVAEAKRRLRGDEQTLCVIDVQRARKGRIRPLPELAAVEAQSEQEVLAAEHTTAAAPDVTEIASEAPAESAGDGADETVAGRLDRWKRRLLDLSLRNRLLNFKDTRKTLRLLCTDLSRLEDMLAAGDSFQILARPTDLQGWDARDPEAHIRRTGQDGAAEVIRDELASKRLHSDTNDEELGRRLVEIYRAARLGLEEGGASALYLAVGFLAWYESDKSEQRRLAPLLLIPLALKRKSVNQGFTLSHGDDEPRFNVTLLEMLKQDHGLEVEGLDPLPGDDSGMDVSAILHSVRRAVRDIERWDVLDQTNIGLFSFSKFLMWRDLSERTDDLLRNPVVDHLVNRPDQAFPTDGAFPNADRLDEERHPKDTFCPMPADSSQLAAVFAAAEGLSFVLEGPPGTGKSQTITNLIAHCLSEGKRVLFVSEKMAALNVVHRRLSDVGLGRFCLELHSNKAHKSAVIGQLADALDSAEAHDPEEWDREAARLASLRGALNAYAQAIHKRRSSGETIYQVMSRLIGLRSQPRIDLNWPSPETLGPERLTEVRDLVERLETAGAATGEIRDHAWNAVRQHEWTPGWETSVRAAVSELNSTLEVLIKTVTAACGRLGLGAAGLSLEELDRMQELARAMLEAPAVPPAIVTQADWEDIEATIGTWIQAGNARDVVRADLRTDFRDQIASLDLDSLRAQVAKANTSWWPLSWWHRRPVRATLSSVANEGVVPGRQARGLEGVIDKALTFRHQIESLARDADRARKLLGRNWQDGEADWDEIRRIRDWAKNLRGLALLVGGDDFEKVAALREKWARLASEGQELLRPEGAIGGEFLAFLDALVAFRRARGEITPLLDLDDDKVWGEQSTPDVLGRTKEHITRWIDAENALRGWCAWRRARQDAMRHDLAPLVEAFEMGAVQVDQLRTAFERSYAEWWTGKFTDHEPVLSQFFSPEHERKIEQFRALDEKFAEMTRSLIQARLGAQVPTSSSAAMPNSEMGILKHEAGKKRRLMSVRNLFQKLPNLLPRLKPCLLMSPISVAQYLDSSHAQFDLVVFDEASQIPVWDAVGAIARGRQAVVVGDPKQLPPTSFFQRAEDDDDVPEDVTEDLESILDECIAAQIPGLPLNWHYRSRHESLIAFSNYHYYENRLLTFPSPMREGMGVSWRHVPDGIYDKGKSRTNRTEATAVVDEVLRRLRDPELAALTIGVVTFNQAQQVLIEDLLDNARAKEAALDGAFADEEKEPVFVKNLENVQGDERDVILFSICYGPDLHGKVAMNFGPMNREGGERRLNVAITRARREVCVFSTLRANQIDLAKTRARGVRDLKNFLEYADRGPAAIAAAVVYDPDADFDSPFEEAVYDALVDKGWVVYKQVGCARYRIDLAVVDPAAPGRYLMGVECDGANYHRAKTARDRDKLREAVLRDLGWQLHRVWSSDWWTDPGREIEKLEEALRRAQEPVEPGVETPVALSCGRDEGRSRGAAEEMRVGPPEPVCQAPDPVAHYQPLQVHAEAGTLDDFYESYAVPSIREQIREVARAEGPVSLMLTAKRIAEFWGFGRVGARSAARIRGLIPANDVDVQVTESGEFLWLAPSSPEEYGTFRVPARTNLA